MTSGDVEAGGELQQMTLRIGGHIDLVPHMPDDDLARAQSALWRPSGAGPEDPRDVTAREFERDGVTVECGHEPDVVQHRRHVEQLRIELDALTLRMRHGPDVRAQAMVEQRG